MLKLQNSVFALILIIGIRIIKAHRHEDYLIDPASRTMQDYKERHQKNINLLTTSAGKPVDIRETSTFNSDLLTNQFFIDNIKHLTNERTPDREVNPKGTGAHGFFEVTNDVSKYSKAKLFEKVGKRTRVFVRFGCGQIENGGTDALPIAIRGLSLKFYTEEGNLDLLNVQTPVYLYRHPLLFPMATHAIRKLPKHNIRDITSLFDFIILQPQALHWLFWAASEYGLPRGFRHMNGFPIHVYELYNERGESYFVRFKFLSELGYDSLSLEESRNVSSTDPDLFIRDLYNAIEVKHFPSWRMEMDILNENLLKEAKFNPFDVTAIWPNGTYHTVTIGRVVLNRNVDNHFREVEQSAFNPANLVPGISPPPDMLFKGRVIAYMDSQIHRLGINHNKIDINCPMYARTYNRDGLPPVKDNERDAPNYFPNSFNGPEPYVDEGKPTRRINPLEDNTADMEQCWRFYNHVLQTNSQKQRLVDNLVEQIVRVAHPVQERFRELLSKVDKELARRFSESLAVAKETTNLPAFVTDLRRPRRDHYEL